MWRLELSEDEIEYINSLITNIASEYQSAENIDFLNNAVLYAHELPRRIRSFLNDFKLREPHPGGCVISGYPVNHTAIGSTPTHWKWRSDARSSLREQILFVLHGSLLGDLIGWATQQDGYMVHDIFPIKGNENEQLGTGSEQPLSWHTEDAFHPYRADYVGFLCLRNPDNVATTIGALDIEKLAPSQVEILFQPRFTIRPDESHQKKNESDLRRANGTNGDKESIEVAYDKIRKMSAKPEKVSVLFGSAEMPYLRLDPYFMDPLDDDPEAQQALNALIAVIDEDLTELVLKPGELCFLDNYRAVHGRRPFKGRYDGNDRWLKRICVTRDLRKSRQGRADATARVIM